MASPQTPSAITQGPAAELKDTNAPFIRVDKVKKLEPPPKEIAESVINNLGPMAVRCHELAQDGRPVSFAALRAAEVAEKAHKDQTLTPVDVAQTWVATHEAILIGLEDPNSPFYQQDQAMRDKARENLSELENRLNFYLTGQERQPQDVTRTVRRFLRRTQVTETVTPASHEPLTQGEITAAENQSRMRESYDNALASIAQSRYGRPFASLQSSERRVVVYSASEEVSRQFDGDERVQKLIDQVTQRPGEDAIAESLNQGTEQERRFARRVSRFEEDRIEMLRKHKELYRMGAMGDFQRFLVVEENTLSQAEIAEAMIQKLGITGQTAILLRNDPDRVFRRFRDEMNAMGTICFTGELFRWKLDKLREERITAQSQGGVRQPAETNPANPAPQPARPDQTQPTSGTAPAPETAGAGTPPGQENNPGGSTPDANIQEVFNYLPDPELSHLALLLTDGKLGTDPVKYLVDHGVPQARAQEMLDKVITEKALVIRQTDGKYTLNKDKLGGWDDYGLAVLVARGQINPDSPDFQDQINDFLLEKRIMNGKGLMNDAEIAEIVAKRVESIKDLAGITKKDLTEAQKRELARKWGRRGLAFLALLLSPLLLADFNKLLQEK